MRITTYKNKTLFSASVFDQYKKFNNCHIDDDNEHRSGRTLTSKTEANQDKIKQMNKAGFHH